MAKKIDYVEPAGYFSKSMKKILEKGKSEESVKTTKKTTKKSK